MLVMPFASVAEADAYHVDHLFGATWREDMELEDKQMALITASRMLVAHVAWLSSYSTYQTVTPQALKEATAEFARLLFERGNPFADSDTAGMKRMKAGPVDVEFTDTSGVPVPIPPEVMAILAPIASARGSSINVPLIRF